MDPVAIISTNAHKYSETFIHRQIQELSMPVVFYTDGYLPSRISLDRGKSSQPIPKKWWKSTDPISLLKKSLRQHKVTAVLAQYGPSGVAVMDICKSLNIPLIVHFHGYDAFRNDILSSYGKDYPELFKTASKIIAVSDPMKKQLLSLGCPPSKLCTFIYGIDTDLFCPDVTVIKDEKHFVACGRFVAKKAPHLTLNAFAHVLKSHPTATLSFVGDGELLEATKELSKQLNIDKSVHFTGVLTPPELVKVYQLASCFLQHSITTENNDSEGTPLTILEAMATGLPVVATAHGGIPQVVDHNITGFLVPEHDIVQMVSYMNSILEQPTVTAQMGKEGSIKAKRYFTKEIYLENLTKLLENCIG